MPVFFQIRFSSFTLFSLISCHKPSKNPCFCIFSGRGHAVRIFFISIVRGWFSRIYRYSGKTENSLFSHSATPKPPIYRQILRLPCVEVTPISKVITEWRETIYENIPLFRFGFSREWSSNTACSERRILPIVADKQHVAIKLAGSDLTINARPFIIIPVSTGWRRECPAVPADYLDIRPEDSPGIRKLKKLSALDSSQLENLPSDLLQDQPSQKQ